MRRYPGRSRRLFEAPLPDLTPRRVKPPADSLLAPEFGDGSFIAAYTVGVASWSVIGVEDVAAAFVRASPPVLLYVLRPQDVVRRLAGRASGSRRISPRAAPSVGRGELIGAFRTLALTPNEVLLTPDAWLLDLRVSLRLGNDWTRRWLTVTTVARAGCVGGTIALGPFVRLHARTMPAIVGELARQIDTPKPVPPGQHLAAL